jgi:hypothetical protein
VIEPRTGENLGALKYCDVCLFDRAGFEPRAESIHVLDSGSPDHVFTRVE